MAGHPLSEAERNQMEMDLWELRVRDDDIRSMIDIIVTAENVEGMSDLPQEQFVLLYEEVMSMIEQTGSFEELQ